MGDSAKSQRPSMDEFKRQLIKTARMYAMCQKAGVAEPLDVAALAVAAFEDMSMKQAVVFVQSNEQNIKDLAWAFANSSSPEEFEQKVKEIKRLPAREEKP
jgi:tryptophanyl-tRNA synthetase